MVIERKTFVTEKEKMCIRLMRASSDLHREVSQGLEKHRRFDWIDPPVAPFLRSVTF